MRDFVKEAIEIASGESNIVPQREHIVVVVEELTTVSQKLDYLKTILKDVLAEVKKKRVEQGLPEMPAKAEEVKNG